MSKAKLSIIITSTILLVIGGIFLVWGIIRNEYSQSQGNRIDKDYAITEEIKDFDIKLSITDVEFVLAEDGKFVVETHGVERLYHKVETDGETLKISEVDSRRWLDGLFGGLRNIKIKIKLPNKEYNNLKIYASTGDITTEANLKFKDVNIELSTGDIKFDAKVDNDVNIKTSTGHVELNGLTNKNINITTSTGKVKLNKVDIKGKLYIYVSTGDIALVECDAKDIYIRSSTGDVEASLLSDKTFEVKTSTGDVNIPKGTTGDKCVIETSTGDIDVTIVK